MKAQGTVHRAQGTLVLRSLGEGGGHRGFQSFRVSEFQGFRVSGIKNFRDIVTGIQTVPTLLTIHQSTDVRI
ncbi:MAG: hypothetical protein HPY62_02220 [Bacteroidales bacterium]|nr:hypothetical protein [Bacteroidales bacterium]